MTLPTGIQHTITRGDASATIASVAASLREFRVHGVDYIRGYPETTTPPFGSGIVLVPWPNRVEDGVWTLDGKQQQLDLTEPARHNAIHGLLRTTAYDLVAHDGHAVTLAATVWPQHGYPFVVETTVRYELVDDGLRVTHTLANAGEGRAPVAVGTHPFFRIGDEDLESLVLTVHANTRIEVDARLNPTGTTPIHPALRSGQELRHVELDHAFADLDPVDGVVASLRAADGRTVALVGDEHVRWTQVFTTREYPGAGADGGLGAAVAIEPMTAPMNALVTGEGLQWLEPGQAWSTWWGIRIGS